MNKFFGLLTNVVKLALNSSKRKKTPPVQKIDLKPVFFLSSFLWILAFLFVLILMFMKIITATALIIPAFGIFIGLALIVWEALNRNSYFKGRGKKRRQ
jgi:hypothetical protein